MNFARSLYKSEAGVAAIEFALTFPVLLLMVAAIIEYGKILFVEQAVRNIIDDAARTGVITALDAIAIEGEVEDRITEVPGIEEFGVDVTDGAVLTIQVTGAFSLVFAGILPSSAVSFTMSTAFPR